jgi:nitroreductase
MTDSVNPYGAGESPLMDVIRRRVSCRSFSAEPVSDQELNSVIEAARLAPSANNEQPWRFIAVRESAIRDSIAQRVLGAPVPNTFLANAPCILVLCSARPLLSATNIGGRLRDVPYDGLDLGIAGEHLCLRATELGLGTVWIGWFRKDILAKLLHIPRRVYILALIGLGHIAEQGKGRSRKNLEEILYLERWEGR